MANRATVKTAKLPKYVYPFKNTEGQTRYRIRIRRKSFGGVALSQPIDEVCTTLDIARKRVYELEFGGEAQKIQDYQKSIKELSAITIRDLLEKFRDEYSTIRKNQRDWKSRIKNIIETPVAPEEAREFQILKFRSSMAKIINEPSSTVFGDYIAKDCNIYLINRFVDSRLKKVKPQTCINDICTLSLALKNAHQYFIELPKNDEPLHGFDWKKVKYEREYRDKRLSPDKRQAIERLIIEKSREGHYLQFFTFLYETGARLGEALSITIKDIDVTQGLIFVKTKKNNKPRYLGITQRLYDQVIEPRIKEKLPNDRLFPYSKEAYEGKLTILRPLLKLQGIEFTWHDLRHNYISSHMTNGTKNEIQLMSELGLKNVQHFQSRYLDILQSEAAAKKVALSQQLTPQEIRQNVGHQSLAMTNHYTHTGPTGSNPIADLTELVRKQQEQIASLLEALKEKTA